MKDILKTKRHLDRKDVVRRYTDFPINARLSQFLFSSGYLITTRKQSHLLDAVLGNRTVVFEERLTQSLGFALMIGCTELLERRKMSGANSSLGPIVVVCHQIGLKQQLISSFCACAQTSTLSYLVLEERPKEQLPDVDVVFLSSTFLSVAFSQLPKAPSVILSTDVAAMPDLMSVLGKGRLIGFCNQAAELEHFNFTQQSMLVSFEENKPTKSRRAYCAKEDIFDWLHRAILDHPRESVAVLCETEEEALETYNQLLKLGFRVFYMSRKRPRSYSERGVVSLKRGELEVIVSTQFQQSADLHIFLTSPPSGSRFNKAIFVHLDSEPEEESGEEELDSSEKEEHGEPEESADVQPEKTKEIPAEDSVDKESAQEEPSQQDIPMYSPPKLEHLTHQDSERLIFRLLRESAAGERRYAQQAAHILEHPLKEQFLSRLIGMFHKASAIEEKKDREDRSFLERKDSQRPSSRKRHSRGRRNKGRFKKN